MCLFDDYKYVHDLTNIKLLKFHYIIAMITMFVGFIGKLNHQRMCKLNETRRVASSCGGSSTPDPYSMLHVTRQSFHSGGCNWNILIFCAILLINNQIFCHGCVGSSAWITGPEFNTPCSSHVYGFFWRRHASRQ